jgi:hypothetical protein
MRSDPDVVAVRGGGMPSRLGRTQTGVGAAAPAPSLGAAPSGMQQAASMRRAPSRPVVGAGVSGGAVARVPSGIGRSRSTRANGGYGGGADPNDYVGRRVWRMWPTENPPWVEGFVQGWDPGEQAGSVGREWH